MAADGVLALKITVSVVVYFLFVAAVPIYNKEIFSGNVCWSGTCARSFPYPIATAFLQLGFVAVVLGTVNVLGHLCSPRDTSRSWLFGPNFLYKLRHIAPVGVMFGVKYGITNWGLALVPTAKHLLLQSTDLVWTVIFARVINKERLGFLEGLAALLSVMGAVLISLQSGSNMNADALGLAVNLLSPICLALCVNLLRSGRAELQRRDNCLQGSVTPVEFTAIKLALSSLVALALALPLESEVLLRAEGSKAADSWWLALGKYPLGSLGLLFVGGLFVLVFQVNMTWLAGLTSATSVGIVGEVKVLPQWILNALFQNYVSLTLMNLAGAVFSLAGSMLFAAAMSQVHRLVLTRGGFRWKLRDFPEDRVGIAESLVSSLESKSPISLCDNLSNCDPSPAAA